jgi:hypothetical protein
MRVLNKKTKDLQSHASQSDMCYIKNKQKRITEL